MGPKKALSVPKASNAANSKGTDGMSSPMAAVIAIGISTNLSWLAISALSYLSASWPASDENKKKGRIKTAPASAPIDGPFSSASRYTTSIASAFFRRLSLSAERNWHQNNAAKRRAVIRAVNMQAPVLPS